MHWTAVEIQNTLWLEFTAYIVSVHAPLSNSTPTSSIILSIRRNRMPFEARNSKGIFRLTGRYGRGNGPHGAARTCPSRCEPPRPLSVLLTRMGGSESVYSRRSALGGLTANYSYCRHLCYHIAITDRCPRIVQDHIARPTACLAICPKINRSDM